MVMCGGRDRRGSRESRGEAGREGKGSRVKILQLSPFSPTAVPGLGSQALWFAEKRELTCLGQDILLASDKSSSN